MSYWKEWYDRNRESQHQYEKDRYQKLREETISAYGSQCVCCGETQIAFLTIDHIDNSGSLHRKEIGAGSRLYKWLRKNDYPKDNFQCLCWNCQWGKRLGICPHQEVA